MATAKSVNQVKSSEKLNRFFRGVWSELKKVHWPNRQALITYTSVVIISVIIISAAVWLLDSVFSFLLNLVI
ncbi:MAG: preprotein translocase subunit SecE [Bacillota bacterium]